MNDIFWRNSVYRHISLRYDICRLEMIVIKCYNVMWDKLLRRRVYYHWKQDLSEPSVGDGTELIPYCFFFPFLLISLSICFLRWSMIAILLLSRRMVIHNVVSTRIWTTRCNARDGSILAPFLYSTFVVLRQNVARVLSHHSCPKRSKTGLSGAQTV
jgi:hypothetical protein